MNPVVRTVEDLCKLVGSKDESIAQMNIEAILDYLQNWGVIENYNADKLDWIFSDNESN